MDGASDTSSQIFKRKTLIKNHQSLTRKSIDELNWSCTSKHKTSSHMSLVVFEDFKSKPCLIQI